MEIAEGIVLERRLPGHASLSISYGGHFSSIIRPPGPENLTCCGVLGAVVHTWRRERARTLLYMKKRALIPAEVWHVWKNRDSSARRGQLWPKNV